jgi:YD repeat-containing protein
VAAPANRRGNVRGRDPHHDHRVRLRGAGGLVQDDHGRADRVYGAPWVVHEVPHRQWARGLHRGVDAAGTDAETAGRTTPTYDRWGRTTSSVGDAGTVTTLFDAAGGSQQVTDAKGTTTFGYDGTGERRGLLTSQTVTRGGSAGTLTYTAAYDADGNLTSQTMPGGIRQVTTYDAVGEPVGLEYRGQVTTVEEVTDPVTGETTWTPTGVVADQPWLTWSTVNDVTGRVRFEATGQGAAFSTGTGVTDLEDVTPWVASTGDASSYAREYTYDGAGRLTRARDNTTAIDPATGDLTSSCTDRAYTFNTNGNRTKLVTTRPARVVTAPLRAPPPR